MNNRQTRVLIFCATEHRGTAMLRKSRLLYLTTLAFLLLLFSSCMRLDNNLYNPSTDISEYKLDAYSGEQDFILDASYTIPDSLIHQLTLFSQAPGENEATRIRAIYIGSLSRIASDTVIMYCHGNKDHMDFYWQRAKLLAHVSGKNRYGVLMIDYRGFGLSEGKSSEEGLYADVDAALQWLKSMGLTNSRLMMYGFSMGTAPVCELTNTPRSLQPAKFILEAPFASADVMAADGSGLNMPGSFFTNLKIDNAEEVKTIRQPLCWLHGTNDNFLNIKTHGEVVFSHYGGTYREAHRIDGADHGEVPEKAGFANYLNIVSTFIRK